MYNRYVRNDKGTYRRIHREQAEVPPKHPPECEPANDQCRAAGSGGASASSGGHFGIDGMLSGLLGRFKLSEIDAGDLLLLVLLFLLFCDGEDEELLIALGLLLIL